MQPKRALDNNLEQLYEMALSAARNSYSPYSRFQVGAALELDNGVIVTGTNVENMSFGLTICAERSALVRAVSEFGPQIRIRAVAVANLSHVACPPCGACRQMLAEFAASDSQVLFEGAEGPIVMTFAEILPVALDLKLK